MKMKNIYCALLFFFAILLSAQGQSSFYYTFDAKKPLNVQKTSFSVSFNQAVNWQKLVRSGHPLIKKVHGQAHKPVTSIVIELKEQTTQTLGELMDLFIPSSNLVKDMHWGLQINPELEVWLNDELLYQPAPSWNTKQLESILLRYPEAKLQKSDLGLYSIKVSKLAHTLQLSNELVESGMVNWAHPNFMGGLTLFSIPTDPKFFQQYSFHNIGQTVGGSEGTIDIDINGPEAWDLTLGSSSIKVGVLDEGVEDHEDLEDGVGNSRVIPGYPVGPGENGVPQLNIEGHGQSIAGLIGASHNNLGVAGVAPNSQIIPAYVSSNSTSVIAEGVAGMRYLWKVAQVDIINNSYGFKSPDPNLFPALVSEIDSAQIEGRGGLGCIVLFATGENVNGNTYVNFPANRDNVIAVGAIDSDGDPPAYSPIGPTLDIVVPSSPGQSNVRSIDRMDTATVQANQIGFSIGNYVDYFGGTSASCAIASGVAALVLSVDPNLTYTEVESIFKSTALDLGTPGRNDDTGFGILRADAAVSFALGSFPVEWLDIKGELINDQIEIEWLTANEQNNAFFEIQRSSGASFQTLGQVAGAGSSSEVNTYLFTDPNPQLGNNYYRIKQVDIDGKATYSPVINISRTEVNTLALSDIYPNPSQKRIHFDFALPRSTEASYRVLDLQGRMVSAGKLAYKEVIQQQEIEVANWTAGIYVLVLKTKKGTLSSKRFLVQP